MRSRAFIVCLIMLIAVAGCSKNKISKTELALFEKANQAQMTNNYQQALDIYLQIAKEYSSSAKLDKALFMIGFIKSENLNDKPGAITYYQQLLDKFPNSDLADDAKFMIDAIKSGKDAFSAFQNKTGQ